jgi:hypothetical protein
VPKEFKKKLWHLVIVVVKVDRESGGGQVVVGRECVAASLGILGRSAGGPKILFNLSSYFYYLLTRCNARVLC